MLFKLVYIEHKKTKRSFAFWLSIFGSMIVPGIVFLSMMIIPKEFMPNSADTSIWKSLISINFKFASPFLFPMYIIYLIGLMGNLEYKSSNWKKLFVMPIRKEWLITGKMMYLLLHIFCAILLFVASTLLFGYLAGIFHPEFNLLKFAPDFELISWLVYHLFLAVIGIIGLQFLMSVFFENILITLAIGLFLMIASLIAVKWEFSIYIPYSAPSYFQNTTLHITEWCTTSEGMSLILFAVSYLACLFFFKRKTVK